MNEIINGLIKAIELIVTLDPEVIDITLLTLRISIASILITSLIFIPTGSLIHFHEFRGKRWLINIIQTLFALPTVVVGLLVFLLLSRAGPLGFLGFFFTPTGMVIGQVILIAPIMTGLTISALSGVDKTIRDTIVSLGATEFQAILATIKEARYAILAAVIAGYSRGISEVGAAMMIGGNIRGYTRVLTTAIALETSMGNIEFSLALGIILMSLAFVINIILNRVQQR
ncbi:MAG: ABC transporter permease [Methanocellales archaeon]|nr:ABC transporter permease [Methanocellales archaeon]MDD3420801.1 ABC transporter permease [Methanocellales archaeon]MDD4897920.1 ABC transporter permease [Methanocellales archaeon]MDD5446338.1 ABC transporter permease [Methanocellales archaeon]